MLTLTPQMIEPGEITLHIDEVGKLVYFRAIAPNRLSKGGDGEVSLQQWSVWFPKEQLSDINLTE